MRQRFNDLFSGTARDTTHGPREGKGVMREVERTTFLRIIHHTQASDTRACVGRWFLAVRSCPLIHPNGKPCQVATL